MSEDQKSKGFNKQRNDRNPSGKDANPVKREVGNKPKKRYKKKSPNIDISVVAPVFNESESLPELSLQLESSLQKLSDGKYEVIFVDDGSTDDSFDVIRKINQRNRKFKAIKFRRNYGKSAALDAGFKKARGKYVFTVDTDLQDDPEEFENMLAKMKEGFDLVSGWKIKRKDPISKTIPSKLFNLVTSKTSGIKLHDFNCGLKLYRREVVKSLDVYGEMHRYLPALAHWNGFRVTEIPVNHRPRQYGRSKFGITRFINGYLDLLTVLFTTRYFKRPLHFFGLIGTLFALIGFAMDLYLTILWFLDMTDLTNRPLALFGVALIIVGVQLISMGLIGELIVKNNIEKINYQITQKI